MFSPVVLDHFNNPRYCGPIEDWTHEGIAGTPGDGPYVVLQLVVVDGIIERAAYSTYGCPAAVAAASILCELAAGRSVDRVMTLTADDLMTVLGGLPEGKTHCAERSIVALQAAMKE